MSHTISIQVDHCSLFFLHFECSIRTLFYFLFGPNYVENILINCWLHFAFSSWGIFFFISSTSHGSIICRKIIINSILQWYSINWPDLYRSNIQHSIFLIGIRAHDSLWIKSDLELIAVHVLTTFQPKLKSGFKILVHGRSRLLRNTGNIFLNTVSVPLILTHWLVVARLQHRPV